MYKSPLTQALGLALEIHRNKMNLTVEEVCDKLQTSITYYKSVEAGTHNLHVSKAYLLWRAFDRNDAGLNLPSLLHILGFVSMLDLASDKEKVKNQAEFAKNYYNNFIEYTKNGIDHRMKYIRVRFETVGVFDKLKTFNHKEIRTLITKSKLDWEIATFIDRPASKDQSISTNLYDYFSFDFFSDFPTFYLEHLLDVKISLKKLPIKYDYKSAMAWEIENKNKIVRIIGACVSKEFLASKLSLRHYSYSYLDGLQFKDMRFIVLDSISTASEIKEELKDELLKALHLEIQLRQKREFSGINVQEIEKRIEHIDDDLKKISIKVYDQSLMNIENLLNKPFNNTKFNTFWVFELERGYYLGVKASIPNEKWRFQDAEYLKYGEAKDLVEKFNSHWDTENTSAIPSISILDQ